MATVRRLLRHWQLPILIPLVVFFAWRAWAVPGGWHLLSPLLVAAGLLMNAAVMVANGGRMPVVLGDDEDVVDAQSDLYTRVDDQTRLRLLADWLTIGSRVFSPGDFVLYTGVAVGIARILFER